MLVGSGTLCLCAPMSGRATNSMSARSRHGCASRRSKSDDNPTNAAAALSASPPFFEEERLFLAVEAAFAAGRFRGCVRFWKLVLSDSFVTNWSQVRRQARDHLVVVGTLRASVRVSRTHIVVAHRRSEPHSLRRDVRLEALQTRRQTHR